MLAFDVIIIGGGVAGLWTLNRLRQQGYHAILLEKKALGSGQTIASQGIIHGGIKYSLQGALSRSSQEISDMPAIWQQCLTKQGDIDLSSVSVLSQYYYLCSQQSLTQSITQFFAQKALRSQSAALNKSAYPDFFANENFTGRLTQVDEVVLDVPSLIAELAKPMWPYIFKINSVNIAGNNTVQIVLDSKECLILTADKIILTAGEGNAQLLAGLSAQPLMQRRPLHMVALEADNLPALYVHSIALNTNPVLTITSHSNPQGKTIWYLGGQLAEDGVHRNKDEQIQTAAKLIAQQFPWFTIKNPQWQTLRIDRAEGFNNGVRPESIMLHEVGDVIATWPTKLTFAPLLAEKISTKLPAPKHQTQIPAQLAAQTKPSIAAPIWQ